MSLYIYIFFKKRLVSKRNKDGDNNTATQSKGHSMRLPLNVRCSGVKHLWAERCDPVGRGCSAVK